MKRIIWLFVFGFWGCSVVIPPITFTGSKTAAEKQIIGEETELEEDVWMISSAKTASEVDESEGVKEEKEEMQEKENRYMYRAFSILDAFADNLAELKRDRVVGENNRGFITNMLSVSDITLPDEIREKYSSDSQDREKQRAYRMLVETIKQINIAREYMIEGYIINQRRVNPSYSADRKELAKLQKEKYQKAALKGEFIQTEDNRWVVK